MVWSVVEGEHRRSIHKMRNVEGLTLVFLGPAMVRGGAELGDEWSVLEVGL